MKRFSTSSMRQSLGMPSRNATDGNEEGKARKPRAPVGMAGSRPSTASSSQRRKTVNKPAPSSQYNRRQTQSGALGGSRTSTGRSSIYGQSHSTQVKKDPRQLSEKAHQSAAIRKLIAFLSENNYPKTLTPKALQLPTTREFLNIFNFLLEMIDETLVVDGTSITESVPKVLKCIRYPFPVSKNHLLNVGSPHSWPILLGALDFLVDLCRIPDRTEEILFGEEFDEGGNECAMDFDLMAVMYQAYMEYGQDSEEFHSLAERRIQGLSEQKERYQEAVSKCLEEKRQLDEAIEELSKSSISSLQEYFAQEKAEYEQVLASLNTELLPQIQHTEQAIMDAESASCQIETQIEECKRKAGELEEQIRSQSMSSKEVQRIRRKMEEDHQMLDKYRDNVENWNQQIAELQMKHNRTVSGIDAACSEANDKLRRLAVVLPDAASLSPLDHDTTKRADPEVLHRLIQHAKSLRHELNALLQRVAAHCSTVENEIISGESTLSTLNSDKVRKQLEIENLEHTLKIEKETLDQKKKMFEDVMKAEQAEKHSMEKELMSLQQRLQDESEAEREHALVKKQWQDEQVRVERELAKKQEEFMEYFTSVTNVLEHMKQQTKVFRGGVEELVRLFKQAKIPTVDPAYLTPVEPYVSVQDKNQ